MDSETARLLTDFVQKVGWLKRDMQHRKEYERYEPRFVRIEQKFSALAELVSRTDPDLAKALRTAFQMPARDAAFKNAEHQKRMKRPGPEDN